MIAEKKKLILASTLILSLHVLGAALLFFGSSAMTSTAIMLGAGGTAYLLGLRHAFDADHIVAIDNTVRKLSAEKKDSSLVGFFFSLGHSTVVLVAGISLALGFTFIADLLNDDGSLLKSTGATIGGLTAGTFLILIALVNSLMLIKLIKDSDTSGQSPKGLLTTILSPLFKTIDKDWKMYPLGLVFGLGFDTATSIALLALSGGAVLSTGHSLAILALPIIFMSGMSLGDTVDSVLMSRAYNYAKDFKKRRKYAITITSVSIFAALIVGIPILLNTLFEISATNVIFPAIEYEYFGLFLAVIFVGIWIFARLINRKNRQPIAVFNDRKHSNIE
jgi:high-affinity nickel-transport protein